MQGPGGPGNYFAQDQSSWSSAEEMYDQSSVLASIRQLAENFRDQSFSFQLALCEDACEQNSDYQSSFGRAVKKKIHLAFARSIFDRRLDLRSIDLFFS